MNDGKLPRGHAYLRMRNRGYTIEIEYMEVDSEQAERAIKAAMAVVRDHTEPEVADA